MKILVIGDHIHDVYIFHTASRICPEAPVPVLVYEGEKMCDGGAGLVRNQLLVLIGGKDVEYFAGSYSTKERIFADGHLVCRRDRDSHGAVDIRALERDVIKFLKKNKPDAIVASDYGKGTFTEGFANRLVQASKILDIPLFVDAKNHWSWYRGAFAFFPNEKEKLGFKPTKKEHVIQKLGAKGSMVDGHLIAGYRRDARDTTGAGDIYLAAFVVEYLQTKSLTMAALFGNFVAGASVEYVGTKVITPEIIKMEREIWRNR